MMNGKYFGLLIPYAVNDAIATDNEFTNVLDSEFRNDSSRPFKAPQLTRRPKNTIGEGRRNLRRIARDQQANRFEIVGRLRRPAYFSHLAMRSRTSSWLINSPRSACWRPRFTL